MACESGTKWGINGRIARRIGEDTETQAVKCRNCFFFNDTATTEIYTLSLHDALPISTVFKKADTAFFGKNFCFK